MRKLPTANKVTKNKTERYRLTPDLGSLPYQLTPQHVWYHQLMNPIHWIVHVCSSRAILYSLPLSCVLREADLHEWHHQAPCVLVSSWVWPTEESTRDYERWDGREKSEVGVFVPPAPIPSDHRLAVAVFLYQSHGFYPVTLSWIYTFLRCQQPPIFPPCGGR